MMNAISGGQLEDLTNKPITECVRTGLPICSTDKDIDQMKKFLTRSGITNPPNNRELVVDTVKHLIGVEKEADIYENKAYQNFTGHSHARHVLNTLFKAKGPADSTALLDNFNIDETLTKWALHSQEEFGKKFLNIPFQMIDFAKTRTELAQLDVKALIDNGYDSFGVVVNTDVSTGRGIHWFCLYGDLRSDPVQLEYFNSSGFPPRAEIQAWLEQTVMTLAKSNIPATIIYATGGRQIQYSKTECGVWSLVYILSRLTNHKPSWIATVGANDDDMVEFRRRLFRL